MYKKIFSLFIAAVMLCSCAQKEHSVKNGERLQVYASFYAMYDLARFIGGDKTEVICMTAPGAQAHEYEPSAADIARMGEADIFVYAGNGMEPWAQSVSESLPDSVIKVNASEGIEADENKDPHLWLSPELAKREAENIADAMIEADPQNEAVYKENLEIFAQKADELEKRRADIASQAKRGIVVAHKAFGYLGIEQIGLENEQGTGDPSAAQMAKVVEYIRENDVKYVFAVDSDSAKTVDAVAAETDAQTDTLSTLESDAEGRGYYEIMSENLDKIQDAVK